MVFGNKKHPSGQQERSGCGNTKQSQRGKRPRLFGKPLPGACPKADGTKVPLAVPSPSLVEPYHPCPGDLTWEPKGSLQWRDRAGISPGFSGAQAWPGHGRGSLLQKEHFLLLGRIIPEPQHLCKRKRPGKKETSFPGPCEPIYFLWRYRSTGTVTRVATMQQVTASNRPCAPTMANTREMGLETPFPAAMPWM